MASAQALHCETTTAAVDDIKPKHSAAMDAFRDRRRSLRRSDGDAGRHNGLVAIRGNSGRGTSRRVWRLGLETLGDTDVQFLDRLLLHYGIYRRYPLRPWPAFKNAWRISFR